MPQIVSHIDKMLSWLDAKSTGLLQQDALVLATVSVLTVGNADWPDPLLGKMFIWSVAATVALTILSSILSFLVLRLSLSCVWPRGHAITRENLDSFRESEILFQLPDIFDMRWGQYRFARLLSFTSLVPLSVAFGCFIYRYVMTLP
jgi:hypothetical protein